jgi:hypothetical protein
VVAVDNDPADPSKVIIQLSVEQSGLSTEQSAERYAFVDTDGLVEVTWSKA